jgi:hypothetical protein
MFLTEWNRVIERHPDTKKVRFLIDGKIVTPESHGYEDGLLTIQLTEPTLWDGNHPRQAEWDALWDKHVPASGEADTPYGEAIRALGRLQYEYYNNGFCNALEDGRITDFYQSFIETIRDLGFPMNEFERWMRGQSYGDCDFDIHAARQFNAITEYILNYDSHNK